MTRLELLRVNGVTIFYGSDAFNGATAESMLGSIVEYAKELFDMVVIASEDEDLPPEIIDLVTLDFCATIVKQFAKALVALEGAI